MSAPAISTQTLAEAFFDLFPGFDGTHGETRLTKQQSARGKIEAISTTVHTPPSLELWEKHLAGKLGLGIAPLRTDGTCRWGAIDIDDYGLDWEKLERDLARLELPLIPCKTKSGGAHLYLFLSEDVEAELVRQRLSQWAAALGHAGVEVFPKQTRLEPGESPSWLNMPYWSRTKRQAIHGGKALDTAVFFKVARASTMSREELERFQLPEDERLPGAPPCLQCLAQTGCAETRNKFLFNLGVYARKRHGEDGLADKLDEYNRDFMQTPLGHKEVAQVAKSVGKKSYGYTCKEAPISAVCDRKVCLTREFGIGGAKEDKPNAVEVLLEAVTTAEGEVWHTADSRAFVSLTINGCREHLPVKATALRRFLTHRYGQVREVAPRPEAMQNVLALLDSRAIHDGPEHEVWVRIADEGDAVYIDLANEAREAVRITAEGWDVVQHFPVRFHRPVKMRPLPRPERGGSVEALRPFVRVREEGDFRLLLAFMVGCLRPRGPYPQLHINGVHGAAKTMLARIVLQLIDPSTAGVRTAPKEEHDLMIAATKTHLLAFDNLSGLTGELSDALCRLSTGGGLGKRELYTDGDEVVFDVQRPVILTGITELAMRADLRDRALVLDLPPIPDEERVDEGTLWAAFEAARPAILGALYTAVSRALRDWPTTKLARSPRMADFARWVTAAEPALDWERGAFVALYTGHRDEAATRAVDDDALASALRDLAEEADYMLTPKDLLAVLTDMVGPDVAHRPFWPKTARGLSAQVKRAIPDLAKVGVRIEYGPRGKERSVCVSKEGRESAEVLRARVKF